jgi:ribonuclease D
MGTRYVESRKGLAQVRRSLEGVTRLALDLEAAGFHRYSDRICLIQLSTENETFLLDPFSLDPAPVLRPVLEDPEVEVVMHGADFDLRVLDRDLGIRVRGLFDTQVAASLLGVNGVGLSSLLERTLDVRLSKKHQRADWAQRPLPQGMRDYAAMDTAHLLELADRLKAELRAKKRLEWALEESRELEKVRWEPPTEEDPVLRVKGSRELTPRELARLRAALEWREEVARKRDRAPFRIAGNEVLLEAARRGPTSLEGLEGLRGMNRTLARKEGDRLLELFREVSGRPEDELEGYPEFEGPGRGRPLPEEEERLARLKEARNARARELEMDRGTLLPNHVLEALAESPPENLDELADVDGVREWRLEAVGKELLSALGSAPAEV